MSYSTDKPITSKKEDVLGRKDFSKRLGRLIYNYQGEDGLVLGLYGEWGSGKTSVINMVEEEINELAEKAREEARKKAEEGKVQSPSEGDRKEDDKDPLIIRFSPWYYSDNDNLISLFFQSLKNKIDKNEVLKKSLGEILNDYVSVFEALSFVPIPGSKAAAKFIQQQIKASYKKKADLDNRKKALEKALKKFKKKIVIAIDDIDRLTNTQIRDIFQLVKSVGDLPYIIYILAMDREIVERALTEVHQTDGSRYLEKIIQMPVELPMLNQSELEDILCGKLHEVISKFLDKVIWNEEYRQKIFMGCLRPYITTLRDVNRLINVFQFRYGMLYEEVAFEDMLGVTTLEVFEPKLYRWIYNNKDAVCGGGIHGLLLDNDTKPDYRKLYSAEFIEMGVKPERAIRCIATMFPIFAKDVNEYPYTDLSVSELGFRGNMRVADMEKFELYFVFNLENIEVPRSLIKSCLFKFNKNQLNKVIKEIITQGNIRYFIEESIVMTDKIPYSRLDLIASVILDLCGEIKGDGSRSFFIGSIEYIVENFIETILKRLNTEIEKYNIIHLALEKIDKNGLSILASIITGLEYAYGRLGDSENKEKQIISLEHLKELEKMYVAKVHTISKTESILMINSFQLAFNLWQFLDKEDARLCLKEILKDEINKLKFIFVIAGKWYGSDSSSGWYFYLDGYLEYISKDELYNTIQSFDKRKLDNFKETEQIQLASFYLGYSKSDMGNITEEEAKKLLNEWKTA